LAQQLRIPRRSTLVLLKGREELGRIVAGTSKAEIKSLLDKAFAAS
jgi:thioredoxin 1